MKLLITGNRKLINEDPEDNERYKYVSISEIWHIDFWRILCQLSKLVTDL